MLFSLSSSVVLSWFLVNKVYIWIPKERSFHLPSPFSPPISTFHSFPEGQLMLSIPHPGDLLQHGLAFYCSSPYLLMKPSQSMEFSWFDGKTVEFYQNLLSRNYTPTQIPFVGFWTPATTCPSFYSLSWCLLSWICVHFPVFLFGCKCLFRQVFLWGSLHS